MDREAENSVDEMEEIMKTKLNLEVKEDTGQGFTNGGYTSHRSRSGYSLINFIVCES